MYPGFGMFASDPQGVLFDLCVKGCVRSSLQRYGSAGWEDHSAVCSGAGDWASSCYSKLGNVCGPVPSLGFYF